MKKSPFITLCMNIHDFSVHSIFGVTNPFSLKLISSTKLYTNTRNKSKKSNYDIVFSNKSGYLARTSSLRSHIASFVGRPCFDTSRTASLATALSYEVQRIQNHIFNFPLSVLAWVFLSGHHYISDVLFSVYLETPSSRGVLGFSGDATRLFLLCLHYCS